MVELEQSRTALGRLEQPLTYWNAIGALAGDRPRARRPRDGRRRSARRGCAAACAAATAPLGLGVVLTFSRGALVALAVGLAVLCLLAPTRAQLRAVALALAATVVAGAAGIALDGIRTLGGSSRELDGAAMLALLLALMGGARRARPARAARRPAAGTRGRRRSRGRGVVVLLMVAIGLSGATPSTGTPAAGADPARFASAESNRYAYWRVALEAFADHPLAGRRLGRRSASSGGASARSPTRRATRTRSTSRRPPSSASSGCCCSARRSRRRRVGARRGPPGLVAALLLYAAHAGIDWDWEMPALTLVALLLAGALSGRPEPAG